MSDSFELACDLSTRASGVNGGLSVELLEDGTYRVFLDSQMECLFDSSGIVLSVPVLEKECFCKEDPFYSFYDDAERSICEAFAQKMADIASQQKKLQNL